MVTMRKKQVDLMKKIIGIDIGGTKIAVVVGTVRGRIIAKRLIRTQTSSRRKANACIAELMKAVEELKGEHVKKNDLFGGIGICIPGPAGDDPGVIKNAPNLQGWNGIDIGALFRKRFRSLVVASNDANAACVAEKLFGHGAGHATDFMYVTISTGIGSGIIVNDHLIEGHSNSAGELGHCVIEPAGALCNCGKHGCLETLSSGTAIARFAHALRERSLDYKKATEEFAYRRFRLLPEEHSCTLKKKSLLLTHSGPLSAHDVANMARQGDQLARYIYFRAGFYFGIGLSNIIQLIDPGMITLGGSVTRAGALYFKPMRLALKEYAWARPYRACRILRARLGDSVGDLGSIGIVVDHERRLNNDRRL
jgi:glucokinase